MNNRKKIIKFFIKIFCRKSSMTKFWTFFRTEQHRICKNFFSYHSFNSTPTQKFQISCFIIFPGNFLMLVVIKNIFSRCKFGTVKVFPIQYGFQEKRLVIFFSKSCQLGYIVKSYFNYFFCSSVFQFCEKIFRRLFSISDCVQVKHKRLTPVFQLLNMRLSSLKYYTHALSAYFCFQTIPAAS